MQKKIVFVLMTLMLVFSFNGFLCYASDANSTSPNTEALPIHRIDFSGVYALSDGVTVQAVYLNGKQTNQYAITGSGNLDVFLSRPDSEVTVVVSR